MCGTHRSFASLSVKRVVTAILVTVVLVSPAYAENVTAVLSKYKASVDAVDSTRLYDSYVESTREYLSEFSDWSQGKTLGHAQNIGRTETENELQRAVILIDETAQSLKALKDEQYRLVQNDASFQRIKDCEIGIRLVSDQLREMNTLYVQLLASYDSLSLYDGLIAKHASAEDVELARMLMENSKSAYSEAMQFEDIGEVKNLKSPLETGKFRATSNFGYRADPFGLGTKFHSGLDLSANMGDAVRSLFNGIVVISSEGSTGYGNLVVIDHGNGLKTLYAHASKNLVSVGQRVKQYETIQLAGSTGRSTGPHLHLGVFVDNVLVDPIKLFYD